MCVGVWVIFYFFFLVYRIFFLLFFRLFCSSKIVLLFLLRSLSLCFSFHFFFIFFLFSYRRFVVVFIHFWNWNETIQDLMDFKDNQKLFLFFFFHNFLVKLLGNIVENTSTSNWEEMKTKNCSRDQGYWREFQVLLDKQWLILMKWGSHFNNYTQLQKSLQYKQATKWFSFKLEIHYEKGWIEIQTIFATIGCYMANIVLTLAGFGKDSIALLTLLNWPLQGFIDDKKKKTKFMFCLQDLRPEFKPQTRYLQIKKNIKKKLFLWWLPFSIFLPKTLRSLKSF